MELSVSPSTRAVCMKNTVGGDVPTRSNTLVTILCNMPYASLAMRSEEVSIENQIIEGQKPEMKKNYSWRAFSEPAPLCHGIIDS